MQARIQGARALPLICVQENRALDNTSLYNKPSKNIGSMIIWRKTSQLLPTFWTPKTDCVAHALDMVARQKTPYPLWFIFRFEKGNWILPFSLNVRLIHTPLIYRGTISAWDKKTSYGINLFVTCVMATLWSKPLFADIGHGFAFAWLTDLMAKSRFNRSPSALIDLVSDTTDDNGGFSKYLLQQQQLITENSLTFNDCHKSHTCMNTIEPPRSNIGLPGRNCSHKDEIGGELRDNNAIYVRIDRIQCP
jgi:hypothetical protein